jgi:hypothetical protein
VKPLTDDEKAQLWEELRAEFPEDEMMQHVHFVRLLHHRQTEGFSSEERVRFFEETEARQQV